MKPWLTLLCFALWLPTALHAQEAAQDHKAVPFSQGLLWKISVPGKAPSFVFGTLHVSDEAVLQLPAEVESALAGSAVFAGEVMLVERESAALQLSMLSTEPALPQSLGPNDWAVVEAQLALKNFPSSLRAHLQPWAALVMLLKPDPSGAGEVLDKALQQRAKRAGKRLVALETAEEQLSLLSNLPLETQLILLREAISNVGRMGEDLAALTRLYLARDLAGAWALQLEAQSSQPQIRAMQEALNAALIDARNRGFVARMKPLLDDGGAFVALGALHLYGDKGVPALLSAEGFAVEVVY